MKLQNNLLKIGIGSLLMLNTAFASVEMKKENKTFQCEKAEWYMCQNDPTWISGLYYKQDCSSEKLVAKPGELYNCNLIKEIPFYVLETDLLLVAPKLKTTWSQVEMTENAKLNSTVGYGLSFRENYKEESHWYKELELIHIPMCNNDKYQAGFVNFYYNPHHDEDKEGNFLIGAGLGFGYFNTHLTNDSDKGLNWQVVAKYKQPLNEDLDFTVGLRYINTDLVTQEGDFNIHTVELESMVGLNFGINFKF